jgi:hypothetical protein
LVVTFDELLAKLKHFHGFLSEKQADSGTDASKLLGSQTP